MQSFRLSSMRRLCSPATSLRLAPRAAALPALISCRAQLFSTSLLVRAGYEYKPQGGGGRNRYRTDHSNSHTMTQYPPSPTLYISNLPWEATAHDIETAFEEFEGLKRVTVGTLPDGRSKGYAHVQFGSEEQATTVYNAHKESPFNFGEREIKINYGGQAARAPAGDLEPSPCLFVGSIPYTATEQDIKAAFGALGKVSSIRIGHDHEGASKGYAHVEFVSAEEAERVLDHYKSNPIQIQERDVRIDRATTPGSMNPPSARLYYKGFTGEESELSHLLGEFGEQVQDIHILKNRQTGATSGTGFIQFADTATATRALKALNAKSFDGARLEFAFAKPRITAPRSADGGFGLRSYGARSEGGGYSRRPSGSHGSAWGNHRGKSWDGQY